MNERFLSLSHLISHLSLYSLSLLVSLPVYSQYDVVEFLLKHHADVTLTDLNGETAVDVVEKVISKDKKDAFLDLFQRGEGNNHLRLFLLVLSNHHTKLLLII